MGLYFYARALFLAPAKITTICTGLGSFNVANIFLEILFVHKIELFLRCLPSTCDGRWDIITLCKLKMFVRGEISHILCHLAMLVCMNSVISEIIEAMIIIFSDNMYFNYTQCLSILELSHAEVILFSLI